MRTTETEPDPHTATCPADFRRLLGELMRWAGYGSLQQLEAGARAQGGTMPVSTANRALNADKIPTADFVDRFATACGGTPARWLAARDALVDRGYPRTPPPRPPQDVSPYPGLAAFSTSQADWFFGRADATADLADRLAERLDDRFPLFVVGPSGAGKSSLLRAGLVPAARQGRFPGSLTWRHALITPTAHPAAVLAAVPRDATTLLVVDQFEELFTLCHDEAEREEFIAGLCAGPPLIVVAGLRADFYGRCTAHPDLVTALRRGHLPLGAMTTPELRDAIEKPAHAVGLGTEPGLAEVMAAELGAADGNGGHRYEPGALPLLAHALAATWRHREGTTLTIAGYRRAGGIRGTVTAAAERVYQRLDDVGQPTARALLLRMIHLGDGTPDTRRRCDRADLVAGCDDAAAAEAVLHDLANARLVTLDEGTAEIAHEILLRAWSRLRAWIDADRTRLLVKQRLTEAATEWDDEARHHSALYRGPRLAAVRQWIGPADPDLTPTTRAFLTASLDHERLHHRATTRRRVLLAAVAAVGVAATALALHSRSEATRRDHEATAQVTAYEALARRADDPELSAQLSLAAFRTAPIAETRGSLISTLVSPDPTRLSSHDSANAVRAVAFSPDGALLAVGSQDPVVRLLDPSAPGAAPRQLTGHSHDVRAVAFSPDGDLLATASADRTVRLWDVATGSPVATLTGHSDAVHAVAFSRDGTTLATGSLDDTVRLWNVATRAPLATLAEGHDVFAVAFGPGRLLATAGRHGSARLWDAATGRGLADLTRHTGYVNQVAFSPDGTILATAATDATARLWNVADPTRPEHLAVLTGHTAPVHGLAFSRDGRMVATAGVDATARLWDVGAPARPTLTAAPLTGHTDNVYTVVFSPDGHTIATGSHDRTVRQWEIDVSRIADRICANPRRITEDEWHRHFPGVPHADPCG